MHKIKKIGCLVFFVFVCISALSYQYFRSAFFKPLMYEAPVVFDLKKGSSAQSVSAQLARLGFAKHPLIVEVLMRLKGYDKKLKAGEYLLEEKMSLDDILQKLTSGKVMMHQLTLPEGLTVRQMIEIIEKNEFLTGNVTASVREGEMLPETYTFAKGELRDNMIKKAKADMQEFLNKVWQSRAQNLPLKNEDELLILASLIEKETGINAERGKVASVFINRLNVNMPLQTDPTVIYAITNGTFDLNRSLKRKDLEVDSPYNTYRYKGLPPTPICSPGKAALIAAAQPENTPYFYFVADGKGGHRFGKTLSEHNANIKLWLKRKDL